MNILKSSCGKYTHYEHKITEAKRAHLHVNKCILRFRKHSSTWKITEINLNTQNYVNKERLSKAQAQTAKNNSKMIYPTLATLKEILHVYVVIFIRL